ARRKRRREANRIHAGQRDADSGAARVEEPVPRRQIEQRQLPPFEARVRGWVDHPASLRYPERPSSTRSGGESSGRSRREGENADTAALGRTTTSVVLKHVLALTRTRTSEDGEGRASTCLEESAAQLRATEVWMRLTR